MTPHIRRINVPGKAAAAADPEPKAPFVAPRLTVYGAVVDLTQQFGGSLTPSEREAMGLDP